MKTGDTVRFNLNYLEHMPARWGIVEQIKGGMATVRMSPLDHARRTITVRASILEVIEVK